MGSRTTHFCDVCKKEGNVEQKKLQVIFETEQTEGRSVKPYLSDQSLEMCSACFGHVTEGKGNYLHGHGAMGQNTYYFTD